MLPGAAYRNTVDAQGGLADADRDALAVLAAGADAVVELEIVPDHRPPVQVGRPVADQHGALDRRADFAVLEPIGFGAFEHVFARSDVDLAAAEIDGVDAVLHRGDDLARVAVAGQHVGVGHARHRHMGETFAPAVSRGLHAHQAGVLAVLHVADQNTVLDQHGAIGRRALIVDRQRAAAQRHGAVIDDRDTFRGDLLPHQSGKRGRLLAVEIAFETVADGLVQHHAGPARAEHDVHLAGRRRHRFEIDQRAADGGVDGALPGVGCDEALVTLTAAVAGAAALLTVAVADHDRAIDAHQRPHVTIGLAVAAQDFDRLPGRRHAGRDLAHPRVLGARIGVDGFQKPRLGLETGTAERVVLAIELDVAAWRRGRVVAGIAALDCAHRVGGPLDRRLRHVGGMGIADRLVLDGAQPKTLGRVVGRLLQPAVVERQNFGLAIFEKQLAVVGPIEAARDDFGQARPVEAGTIDEGDGCRGHGVSSVAGNAGLKIVFQALIYQGLI